MAAHNLKIESIIVMIGKNVRRLRRERGLTQHNAADLAGLNRRHYQKIEHAETNATVVSLAMIAAALKVDIGALFAPPPKR